MYEPPRAAGERPRSMRLGRSAAIALLALSFAGACEVFVGGDLGTVLCSDEGSQGPPACPKGSSCIDGVCTSGVKPPPSLGHGCTRDSDCATGDFCWHPSDFKSDGAPMCTRPCCSSSECGDASKGFVCSTPTIGGGNFCRRAADIGRESLGYGDVGEACLAAAYCRSWACVGSVCSDVCCADANCTAAAGGSCELVSARDASSSAWQCESASTQLKAFLEVCMGDAECASGMCLPMGDMLRCAKPCCGSEECGQVTVAGNPQLLGCDYVEHTGSLVRACARILPLEAVHPLGAECALGTECRGGTCISTSGKSICSDVCCTDSSCGDPSFACRPLAEGASWALRCDLK